MINHNELTTLQKNFPELTIKLDNNLLSLTFKNNNEIQISVNEERTTYKKITLISKTNNQQYFYLERDYYRFIQNQIPELIAKLSPNLDFFVDLFNNYGLTPVPVHNNDYPYHSEIGRFRLMNVNFIFCLEKQRENFVLIVKHQGRQKIRYKLNEQKNVQIFMKKLSQVFKNIHEEVQKEEDFKKSVTQKIDINKELIANLEQLAKEKQISFSHHFGRVGVSLSLDFKNKNQNETEEQLKKLLEFFKEW